MWLRLVLGVVYLGMAAGQALSWSQMPGILDVYGLTAGAASVALAAGLIGAQLVTGVWFVARPRSTAVTPVWLYTAVALTWTGLGLQAWLRGIPVDNCGCFGVYLSQELSWFTLAQDALLLVYAALLVRSARARPRSWAADAAHGPGGRPRAGKGFR